MIRRTHRPNRASFITPPDARQHVGFIVYPAGGAIARHAHRPLKRHLVGMSEVLVVRSDHCQMDIYEDRHQLVATGDLYAGDVVIMVGGGHGFRVLEDAVLQEIKQGPYLGAKDKELF